MNALIAKYGIYAAMALVGVGGYWYVSSRATPSGDEAAASDAGGAFPPAPLFYGTGNGTQAVPSSSVTGQTDMNSAIQSLMSAMNATSSNDLALGITQSNNLRDVQLAAIYGDTKIALTDSYTSYMSKFLAAAPTLAKSGISAIGGGGLGADGSFNLNAGIVYKNPKDNLAFASGYDASGNLIGKLPTGDNVILMQSAQKNYDMTKYTDAAGKVQTGVVTTLGDTYLPKSTKVTRPAPNVGRSFGRSLGGGSTDVLSANRGNRDRMVS